MKCAFSRLRRDVSGAVAFEAIFVVLAFVTFFVAICDVGRFYLTVHSVRTLSSELARQTLVDCGQPTNWAKDGLSCKPLPANVTIVEGNVPFLVSGSFSSGSPSAVVTFDGTTGLKTVTASVSYNFAFMAVPWRGTKTLSQTTTMSY